MLQIRIHGRGGQGVVTAAELLSVAAFHQGLAAQAFPSFGSERMGAPVMAYCRIDTQPIRSREPIYHPDGLLIQDSTLLHHVNVFDGLGPQATVIINSTQSIEALGVQDFVLQHPGIQVVTMPASDIAIQHLGRPMANVALVAGYAAVSGALSLGSLSLAITERFPGELGQANVVIAEESYQLLEGRGIHDLTSGKTDVH